MTPSSLLFFALAPMLQQTGQAAPPAPSTYELIANALAAGRITEEVAYKYRVFAAFGDSRLPAEYLGDDASLTEFPASVLQAHPLLSTFSAATRAEVAPFLMPPGTPGSWVELPTVYQTAADPPQEDDGDLRLGSTLLSRPLPPPTWHTVLAAGGKAKLWAMRRHPGDSAKAETIAREVTATIWPELVRLFWEPLSDAGATYDNGGPELDIFLVRPSERDNARFRQRFNVPDGWRGVALYSNPYQCKGGPHFLVLRSDWPLGSATSSGLLQTVAHELTHAITGRIPVQGECKDYNWIREATATWAEHWVYPNAQSEHERAPRFFSERRRSLDHLNDERDLYAYGSYVFPLHLMLHGRRERAIPAMWRAFETNATRPGVDAGLRTAGTNLSKVFPEFAVYNLNRETVNEYQRIDQLPDMAAVLPDSFQASVGGGRAVYEKEMYMGMKYLTARYYHFDFDASVKTVTLDNSLVPISYAALWGLEKIKGTWRQPADWTGDSGKTWCRDIPAEDLEALVLVFSNKEWQDTLKVVDPGRHRPTIRAYPTGCRGWIGTSSMTNRITTTDPALTIVEEVTTTMRFAVDSALMIRGKPVEYWKVVGGSMTWIANVTGKCTGNGTGTVAITDRGPGDEIATLRIWEEGGRLHHSGGNGPWPGDIPKYSVTCPGQEEPVQMTLLAALGFFVTDGDHDQVAPDGKSFGGQHLTRPAEGIEVRHSYSFRCASGC